MNRIRIYLVARISEDAHKWNKKITAELKEPFDVFLPHEHNPYQMKPSSFCKEVFDVDLEAIKQSALGLMLPYYGKDCAWEAGWYANSNKPLVVFVDNETEWLNDWMVKGGLDYVITTNKDTFDLLENDIILKHKKVIFIDKLSDLQNELEKIYNKHYLK